MSETSKPSSTAGFSVETTFRSYDSKQGAHYAQHRRNYSPKFYQTVLDYHKSGGGQFDIVLDVGCGPGMAVRSLAPHFAHAIGLDPSGGMISAARSLGETLPEGQKIRFDVSTAEDLGTDLSPPVADNSVDLITAATAAHWFDMSGFWPRAAQVLKPGGTVALWCGSHIHVDESMPSFKQIQAIIDGIDDLLVDYFVPGNRITRSLYRTLLLPWNLETPVSEFEEGTFVRKEWNTGPGSESDSFYEHSAPISLDMMEKVLATSSPVTRWREAHPEAVGTEEDVVRIVRRKIEKILHDAGVEPGKELLKGDVEGVVLLFKKKASV